MFNFLFLPLPLHLHVIIFYHVTYIFVLFLFHMTKNEQYFNVDRGVQTTQKLVLADVRVVWTGDGRWGCECCSGPGRTAYQTQLCLQVNNIDLKKYRGQVYDGASIMSGAHSGLKSKNRGVGGECKTCPLCCTQSESCVV